MDRKTAERLIQAALALNPALGEIDTIISEMPEGDEKQALIKGFGDMLFIQADAFLLPVRREYPDLAKQYGYDLSANGG